MSDEIYVMAKETLPVEFKVNIPRRRNQSCHVEIPIFASFEVFLLQLEMNVNRNIDENFLLQKSIRVKRKFLLMWHRGDTSYQSQIRKRNESQIFNVVYQDIR